MSKDPEENLVLAFRIAARARNEMIASARLNDNRGALHSAERIMNILGRTIKYPDLSHDQKDTLVTYPEAEGSPAAWAALARGEPDRVRVEHLSPKRALTQLAIELLDQGASDGELIDFVKKHYRLVLLTKDEISRLDKHNRSDMVPDRLGEVGIKVCRRPDAVLKTTPQR